MFKVSNQKQDVKDVLIKVQHIPGNILAVIEMVRGFKFEHLKAVALCHEENMSMYM